MINFFQQYGPVLGTMLTIAIIFSVIAVIMTVIIIKWEIHQRDVDRRISRFCRFCDRFSVYWQDVESECPAWADCEKWRESIR
jgi:hypothetical protein